MKRILRLAVVCGIALSVLCAGSGYTVTSCEHTEPPDGVTALGGNNLYVLVRHPDGNIYVIDMARRSADKVTGLPELP
mgnify:CR=1 FL=1